MDYKRWVALLLFNLLSIGLLANKYHFVTDVIQFAQISNQGIKTNGIVVGEKNIRCSVGANTHLRCIQPVVEFYSVNGERYVFTDIHEYTKGSSLYEIHNKVEVLYSSTHPSNARAFQGNDLIINTVVGGIWFCFIIGITFYIDQSVLYGNKGLLTKPKLIQKRAKSKRWQ